MLACLIYVAGLEAKLKRLGCSSVSSRFALDKDLVNAIEKVEFE
jgi:hypothetical protein